MNRKESNRLILEFMQIAISPIHGGVMFVDNLNYGSCNTIVAETKEDLMDELSEYMKYDKSWDYLMPVVEKIRSLGYYVDITSSKISPIQTIVDIDTVESLNVHLKPSIYEISDSAILATYAAVMKFIQWRNNSQIKNI